MTCIVNESEMHDPSGHEMGKLQTAIPVDAVDSNILPQTVLHSGDILNRNEGPDTTILHLCTAEC